MPAIWRRVERDLARIAYLINPMSVLPAPSLVISSPDQVADS